MIPYFRATERYGYRCGELLLVIKRRGRVVEVWSSQNLVVSAPREQLALALAQGGTVLPLTHVAVGTNGTPPSGTDSAITNPFTKPLLRITRPQPTILECEFVILPDEANGMAIQEFGLLRSDGSLFARRTRKVIEKDADLEIDGFWRVLT